MKKILSLTLAVIMVLSMTSTAFAAETDYHNGTIVTYSAASTDSASYTVTVPAELAPSGEGTVTLSGTWASNKIVTVTADATVTLTNSIDKTETKVLNVSFDGISEAGNNTTSQTFTEKVSVAAIPSSTLFGIWSGKFNYNVEIEDVEIADVEMISFIIYDDDYLDGIQCQAEKGMTWGQWIESDYNILGTLTLETDNTIGSTHSVSYRLHDNNLSTGEMLGDNAMVYAIDEIINGYEYYCGLLEV